MAIYLGGETAAATARTVSKLYIRPNTRTSMGIRTSMGSAIGVNDRTTHCVCKRWIL